jgi:subtilisin
MNISGPVTAAVAVILTVAGASTAQAGGTHTSTVGVGAVAQPKGYVVLLDDTAHVDAATSTAQSTYGASVDNVYRSAIKGYSARMAPAEAKALARTPGVQSVRPDIRFQIAAQRLPTGINRANAERSPMAGINGRDRRVNVDVAVIDTGVDVDHPDLNVYRAGAKNCSATSTGVNDQNGHGTHVAGTIGALDNRFGVVGMAPGARIWPVRVFGASGAGSLGEVICGVDYVTAHAGQIEVANMSLSSPGGRDDHNCGRTVGDPLHQAICASVAAGVTYVVAAGNMSQDASLGSPSSYDEVITVSALADFNGRPGGGARATCRPDRDDTLADFSNYGNDVDLVAPGVCIRSTWLHGRYGTISGTSMASPHVAGGAALYMARHRAASPQQVRSALVSAGTSNWRSADDPDGTQEPLLDVSRF